jgi:hypothetical protein
MKAAQRLYYGGWLVVIYLVPTKLPIYDRCHFKRCPSDGKETRFLILQSDQHKRKSRYPNLDFKNMRSKFLKLFAHEGVPIFTPKQVMYGKKLLYLVKVAQIDSHF